MERRRLQNIYLNAGNLTKVKLLGHVHLAVRRGMSCGSSAQQQGRKNSGYGATQLIHTNNKKVPQCRDKIRDEIDRIASKVLHKLVI